MKKTYLRYVPHTQVQIWLLLKLFLTLHLFHFTLSYFFFSVCFLLFLYILRMLFCSFCLISSYAYVIFLLFSYVNFFQSNDALNITEYIHKI